MPVGQDDVVVRPFPLRDQLPSVLRGVILDVHWDLGRLHALAGLHEVVVPVKDLAWHLRLPFWSVDGVPFQVCPSEVAHMPDRYRAQWDRTMAADLRFPLHARVDSTRGIVVMDGVHRLLKATILGQDVVIVRLVTENDVDAIGV